MYHFTTCTDAPTTTALTMASSKVRGVKRGAAHLPAPEKMDRVNEAVVRTITTGMTTTSTTLASHDDAVWTQPRAHKKTRETAVFHFKPLEESQSPKSGSMSDTEMSPLAASDLPPLLEGGFDGFDPDMPPGMPKLQRSLTDNEMPNLEGLHI